MRKQKLADEAFDLGVELLWIFGIDWFYPPSPRPRTRSFFGHFQVLCPSFFFKKGREKGEGVMVEMIEQKYQSQGE